MDDISTVEEKELQEALVDVRKRKRKKKAIGMAIVAGILVIMIGFIWFAGYRSAKVKAQAEIEQLKSELQHLIDSPVVLEPVTPQIVQSVLSTKTNEISEKYALNNLPLQNTCLQMLHDLQILHILPKYSIG